MAYQNVRPHGEIVRAQKNRIVRLEQWLVEVAAGKRVFYLDAQTYAILYVLVYDRQGNHFRTFFLCYSNPAFSPRNTHVRVPLFAGESWIDHEAQVAAVLTPKQIVYNQPLGPKLFTVENLLRQGK